MRDKRLDNRPTAPHELLLIRAGQHLWRDYKSSSAVGWPKQALFDALQAIWRAKEAVRRPLRAEWLEALEKRSAASRERMKKLHGTLG